MAPKQNLVNLFRESAEIAPDTNTYAGRPGNAGMSQFRIVKEKRGDLIVGFRVQIVRRPMFGQYWRNIGRRTYSIEEARAYRQFLEQFFGKREAVTEEVIE